VIAWRFGMEAEPLIGRTLIGRFRIDRVLGRGGMATVYAAFDQQRGMPVALKVLKRELTRDPMILRRFEREAKAASHLSHPNVVEVIDWGVDSEEAFIAMELAQGLDLLKALAQERPMRQTRAVILLAQVCSALSAAHAKGIVHRDLKPENVLIVPDPTEPGGERAKVLDFGIAKVLDLSKTGAPGDDPPSYVTKTALTRVGTIVGTPAYMSPEQCRGGDIDGRSDIYACGVLLYQLVTGELPFTGETPLHTAMRHIHAQARPPSELRRNLDPSLEQVILKALAKWPGERQQNAAALREELHRTVPSLPDRGDLVLPDLNAPRSPPTKPNPPQLSSAGPHPNALQLASEGSTGGRLGARQPGGGSVDPPSAEASAASPAPEAAASPERQESAVTDSDPATRLHVGGALGATPLRSVRLGGSVGDSPDPTGTAAEGAISAASASLVPSTTRPEVAAPAGSAAQGFASPAGSAAQGFASPAGSAAQGFASPAGSAAQGFASPKHPPHDDDDDEPRTFLMRAEESSVSPATQASPNAQATSRPRAVEVTTDPMEASRAAARDGAKKNLTKDSPGPGPGPARASVKTEPIAQHPGLREHLDSATSVKELQRLPARTDRSPPRAGPRIIKSTETETGLTPTTGQPPPRPAAAPRADGFQPTPAIALHAIPPVPAATVNVGATTASAGNGASGAGRTDRGPVPAQPQRPPPNLQPFGGMRPAVAVAVAPPHPEPPPASLEPGDDDEPATYIREPSFAQQGIPDGGPTSNNTLGRTLVMEEQSQHIPSPTPPTALGAPPRAPGSPTASSPYADAAFAGDQDEAYRGLKATSRIADEAAAAQGVHPQQMQGPHAPRGDEPHVKATVRMNPQETMARVHAQQIAPVAHNPSRDGHGQGGVPQSQVRVDPTLPGNASYGQLQPGQWNEPTVVRRKAEPFGSSAMARTRPKDGLVNQISGLSGTTGVLIGVGLGLGLAAGLLIAFLLLR